MTITRDIFAVGTWNELPFSLNDLKKMAAAFTALKDELKPPVKIGHTSDEDNRSILEDQISLGEIVDMFVDESQTPPKLMAEIDKIPNVVQEAFKKDLFKSVSIELDFDVEHKGAFFDYVVTGLALLGADLPAVNVLSDLNAFMSSNRFRPSTKCAYFSYDNIGGDYMPLTAEQEAELRKQLAESNSALASLQTEVDKSNKDFSTLKSEHEKTVEEIVKNKFENEVNSFKDSLETLVKEFKMLPKTRDDLIKDLSDSETLAKAKFAADAISSSDMDFSTGSDRSQGSNQFKGDEVDAGRELIVKAKEYQVKHGVNFSLALKTVREFETDLTKQWLDSNGMYSDNVIRPGGKS